MHFNAENDFIRDLRSYMAQDLESQNRMSETYWGKNKGRSMEGTLEKFTTFAAVAFMVLAIVLNLV